MSQATKEGTFTDACGKRYAVQAKDFYKYLQKKDLTLDEVIRMPGPKKEEFFLRWKHGMTDHGTNLEFESTLQRFLHQYRDMPIEAVDPYFQATLKFRRSFEEYCVRIKTEIKLWQKSTRVPEAIPAAKDLPENVQTAVEAFGGQVVSIHDTKG